MTSPPTTDKPRAKGVHRGEILDERYRLDKVIGSGAIGKVYAGTQLAVDRKVAIKLLHPSLRERDLSTERFLREAKAVARLSHSNCLTLFDFGSCDDLGCFYMVTEFVEGQTLAERMQKQLLPVDEVYYILYQITAALEHAHERGILHRDLKPENIMLVGQQTDYPRVKVLDFGLARIREEAAQPREADDETGTSTDSRLTNFGELNGTPAYMSPEQCRGELELTPACDYYALGVLAYEMFEGELPFETSEVSELLSMHLNDPIPSMESGRAPDEVEEMVCRMLAKKPDFRLRDPVDIMETLRPYVTLEPSHELSTSTLDRLRREAFGDELDEGLGEESSVPVTGPGEATLVDYDEAHTPMPKGAGQTISSRQTLHLDAEDDGEVSRKSAFATVSSEASDDLVQKLDDDAVDDPRVFGLSRRGWAGAAVGLLAASALLFGWLWGRQQTPGELNEPEQTASEELAEPDEIPVLTVGEEEEDGAEESQEEDEEDEAQEEEAAGEDEEADEAVEEEPPAERPRAQPPRQEDTSAFPDSDDPGSVGGEEQERERPRKLELEY